MRLRTLPLSLSGVLLGIFIASSICGTDALTVVFLIITTSFLQILSNLSNELGDAIHGTDTADREGIHYSIQDGEMTVEDMKKLVKISVLCCCAAGTAMVHSSFGTLLGVQPLLFILLGGAAIVAAMKYTLGDSPYGYRGLGDIFVFIFFGLVSTMGAFYICSHEISAVHLAFLPACAVGFFSIGVLNVNNIRDMKTDELTRVTVAIRLGERNARIYHSLLLCFGWICILVHGLLYFNTPEAFLLPLIPLPLFIIHLRGVWTKNGKALDPMLPLLVMSTFALSVLYGISFAYLR